MDNTPYPRVAVIVVAAGSGTRLAAGAPKAFVALGSETILFHALTNVARVACQQLVVVVPEGYAEAAARDARGALGAFAADLTIVQGGTTRQASVSAGRDALCDDIDIVLIHDAARALTPPDVFVRVVEAISAGAEAAIPVLPVVDTIKRVEGGFAAVGRVSGDVDRAELGAAQTPQGFSRAVLDEAYARTTTDFTDDAALVAALGHDVATVAGDAAAFKITMPADLARARSLVDADVPLATRRSQLPRVGVGTDVHAYGGDGDLWLAGLCWPGEPALSGHSDGDAVAHAIVDALLAAAGLGDIGTHFGTDRPEFSGAHADAFLAHTVVLLRDAGWEIGNVSVQVQANRPRFSRRRKEAEEFLSRALEGAPVTVSATTTDGLGFTGRGEGVAVNAVALVVPTRP